MSSFTELDVQILDGNSFKVTKDFSYYRTNNTLEQYTVTAGFITDFASVPKVLQLLFSKKDIYNAAAVLHDYLYTNHKDNNGNIISRSMADDILKEAMIVVGCSKFTARVFWIFVRLFGAGYWD